MKIILVSNMYPDEGDSVKGVFIKRIVQQLQENDISVEVIAPVNSRKSPFFRYGAFYYQAMKALITRNYNLIYAHYASHSAFPILISRLVNHKIPIVTHVHGSDVFPESSTSKFIAKIKVFMSRRLVRVSSRVIVPSSYFLEKMIDSYAINREKLFVSPSGGVNLDVFYPQCIDKAGLKDGKKVIGFVGRLTEDKGLNDYYHVVTTLRAAGMEVDGRVAGSGPMLQVVEGWHKSNVISYFGSLDQNQLANFYRSLDVFVFPTKREGESLGLVGLEAMACGCPVVAYDSSGPGTYISKGCNGDLVSVGNIAELSRAVERVLTMPKYQYMEMSSSAADKAREFSSHRIGVELANVLKSAVSL